MSKSELRAGHERLTSAPGGRQVDRVFGVGNDRYVNLASLQGADSPVVANEAKQTRNLTKVVTRLESKTICGQFVLLSPNASIVVGRKWSDWLIRGEFANALHI
jgi:hypothetical protein